MNDLKEKLRLLAKSFDGIPVKLEKNGYPYSHFQLTDSLPPITSQYIEEIAELIAHFGNFGKANIMVSSSERGGGILCQALSRLTKLPYILANWYSQGTDGEISVSYKPLFSNEKDLILSLNSIRSNHRVIIVSDILSSGQMAFSLIDALRSSQAKIVDFIAVAEKANLVPAQRILREKGIKVKSLIKIDSSGPVTKVVGTILD